MFAMMSIFISLTSPGSMNIGSVGVYPSQAACEQAMPQISAFLQGKYDDNKEWKYFNTFCRPANLVNAQAN